jgi:hypothetical protein
MGAEAQAAVQDAAGKWWIGWQAGVARETDEDWTFFEGKDGLPSGECSGIETGPVP